LRTVRSYRRETVRRRSLLPLRARRRKPRAVIDANVLAAGISGFRESYVPCRNPSAGVLHEWAEKDNFAWFYTEDIRDEYKEVLKRLRVRPHLIGRVVNLIRDRAEESGSTSRLKFPPTPKAILSASALTRGKHRLKAWVLSPTQFHK
jgi:hypothetical protein